MSGAASAWERWEPPAGGQRMRRTCTSEYARPGRGTPTTILWAFSRRSRGRAQAPDPCSRRCPLPREHGQARRLFRRAAARHPRRCGGPPALGPRPGHVVSRRRRPPFGPVRPWNARCAPRPLDCRLRPRARPLRRRVERGFSIEPAPRRDLHSDPPQPRTGRRHRCPPGLVPALAKKAASTSGGLLAASASPRRPWHSDARPTRRRVSGPGRSAEKARAAAGRPLRLKVLPAQLPSRSDGQDRA